MLRRLEELNAAYEERFGFPFMVFVNGRTRAEIVPIFEARLNRPREAELSEGLAAFTDVARSRLAKWKRAGL